jgi:ferric-dicitrate binding protein FerR (iron transport regulator)
MDDYVERAIALAKDGQVDAAHDLLKAVVHRDSDNLEAWRWLASLGRDDDERREALEHVLQLNPDDDWACQAMEKLRQRVTAAQAPPPVRPDVVSLPPVKPPPADESLGWTRLQLALIAALMLVFSALVGGAGGAFAWALTNGLLRVP